jgi:UDP-N-acetyl-D-glucosamine dehydrogenase
VDALHRTAGDNKYTNARYVVLPLSAALADDGKILKGAKVLVWGFLYKPDIDDDRESPSYEIIELLRERGAEGRLLRSAHSVAHPGRKHDIGLVSTPLSAREFASVRRVILATAHKEFIDPRCYNGVRATL